MMKGKIANWCRRAGASALSIAMTIGGLSLAPMQVNAENDDASEILLASFWTSDEDTSDTLYFSTDGLNFYEICEAYTDATPNDANSNSITMARHNYKYAVGDALKQLPEYNPSVVSGLDVTPQVLALDENGNYVYDSTATTNDETLHDPSIIYKDGYFWMISGFPTGTGVNRRVVTMLGYSKDLLHWSFPTSGSSTNIKLSEVPNVNNERAQYYNADEWDMVAPDFFVDDNGDIYVVFSIGYFALFHEEDERENKTVNDEMYPYIVKISDIKMPEYRDAKVTGKNAENQDVYEISKAYVPDPAKFPESADKLQVTYSDATPIKLPCMTERANVGHNHIDASFFKEGEYYYYTIKENGVTNEIWRIKDLSKTGDPSAWEEVVYDAVTGYEGPCLTKFGGEYFLYMDRLSTFKPTNLNGDMEGAFGSEGTWVAKATTGTTGKLDVYTGWLEDNVKEIKTYKKDKTTLKANRHGTVITVSGDAAKVVRAAARAAGYKDEDLFGTWKESDWTATGWYQKETYLDKSIHGTDVAFYKYYYENGKRIGTSFDTDMGVEKGFNDQWKPDDSGNPYFFKSDKSDPDLDGKIFCSSADDGYNKGEVQLTLPVDLDYYNQVGAAAYGTADSAWRWMRYDWKGVIRKCGNEDNNRLYQDGNTKKWYRYDPETGYMVKGAFSYINANGDKCFMWFDPQTGEQIKGGEGATFETWFNGGAMNGSTDAFAKFTINRRNFMVDQYGSIWYNRYDLGADGIVRGPYLQNLQEEGALPTVEYHSPKLDILSEENHPDEGWYKPDGDEGAWYWYEGGVRQGTSIDPKGVYGRDAGSGKSINRGREIASNDKWYWLDSDAQGKRAVGKEVWVPYIFQDEGTWDKETIENIAKESDACMVNYVCECMLTATGKWVRYDEEGQMLKGWVTIEGPLADIYTDQVGNTYYYDTKTGLMAKGWIKMDDKVYYFDEVSGVLTKGEKTFDEGTDKEKVYNFDPVTGECENPPKDIL